MFFSTLIFVAIFLLIIKYNIIVNINSFRRVIKVSKSIPGPSIYELIKNSKRERLVNWLIKLNQRYGTRFCMWMGLDLYIFLSDPDDIKLVLSSNNILYKSKNYDLLVPWLGRGILLSGGSTWQKARKLLTPAFHFKILESFKNPMSDCCDILINKLIGKADGVPFDLYPFISLYTLDVICETAMGVKQQTQTKTDTAYAVAAQKMCSIIVNRSFSLLYRSRIFRFLVPGQKEHEHMLNILRSETNAVVEARKQLLQDESYPKSKNEETDDGFLRRRFTFLDILLIKQKESRGFTDESLRDEVNTFMFAGHDTSCGAILFTTLLLSQNKDVQARAYNEVKDLDTFDFNSMPYLDAVIKESLRCYPSIPYFTRLLKEDFQLRDLHIPAGATIVISPILTHKDPKYFENPDKFDPERFLKNDLEEMHPFAHIPFSAGPRNCIGQKFAILEIKLTLSKLLREFEFLPVEDFQPVLVSEITLKSENGIYVRLRKRT